MENSITYYSIRQILMNHYTGQAEIVEIESEVDTVWYKLKMETGFFLPLKKHRLVEIDFDERTVKMVAPLEEFKI